MRRTRGGGGGGEKQRRRARESEMEGGREGGKEGNPIVRKLHFSDQNISANDAAAPLRRDRNPLTRAAAPPTSFGYAARILSSGSRGSGLTSIFGGPAKPSPESPHSWMVWHISAKVWDPSGKMRPGDRAVCARNTNENSPGSF